MPQQCRWLARLQQQLVAVYEMEVTLVSCNHLKRHTSLMALYESTATLPRLRKQRDDNRISVLRLPNGILTISDPDCLKMNHKMRLHTNAVSTLRCDAKCASVRECIAKVCKSASSWRVNLGLCMLVRSRRIPPTQSLLLQRHSIIIRSNSKRTSRPIMEIGIGCGTLPNI